MTYVVRVNIFNEDTNKTEIKNLFMFGENFADIVEQVSNYYGEDYLEGINAKIFGPDNFLEFEEYDKELFETVKDRVSENVMW